MLVGIHHLRKHLLITRVLFTPGSLQIPSPALDSLSSPSPLKNLSDISDPDREAAAGFQTGGTTLSVAFCSRRMQVAPWVRLFLRAPLFCGFAGTPKMENRVLNENQLQPPTVLGPPKKWWTFRLPPSHQT